MCLHPKRKGINLIIKNTAYQKTAGKVEDLWKGPQWLIDFPSRQFQRVTTDFWHEQCNKSRHTFCCISIIYYSLSVAKLGLWRMVKNPLKYECSMLKWNCTNAGPEHTCTRIHTHIFEREKLIVSEQCLGLEHNWNVISL